MPSSAFQGLLAGFLDGDLDDARSDALASEMESDADAARAFDEALEFETLLVAAHGERSGAGRVAGLLTARGRAGAWAPWRRRTAMIGAAAAVLAAAAVVGALALRAGPYAGEVVAGRATVDGVESTRVPVGSRVEALGGEDAEILLSDGSRMYLAPSGGAVLSGAAGGARQVVRLERGRARFTVPPGEGRFEVASALGTVVVTGTEFVVELRPGIEGEGDMSTRTVVALVVSVVSGGVSVKMDGGSFALSAGQRRVFAAEPPIVKIHEGKSWVWYARQDQFDQHRQDIERFYDYADKAFEFLTQAWGLKPSQEKYALLVWPKTGGGFAAGDIGEVHKITGKPSSGIGVSFDAFFNEANGIRGWWGYVLMTHEMVNLFTGQIVSGGWPVDWWANHKSPFPLMTAVQIEYALVPEVAIHHARQQNNPLGQMFLKLKDQYGWALFRRAFAAAIEDGIQWDRFGGNPSPLRTNMVCAYLQLAAPEDLTPYFEGVVPDFDAKVVEAALAAREKWRALKERDPRRARLKAAYLRGDFKKPAR